MYTLSLSPSLSGEQQQVSSTDRSADTDNIRHGSLLRSHRPANHDQRKHIQRARIFRTAATDVGRSLLDLSLSNANRSRSCDAHSEHVLPV